MDFEMNNIKGKKILIFQQRIWAVRIGQFLAEKLQAQGCNIGAITFKNSTDKFIKDQNKVNYQFIVSHDEIMSDPKKFVGDNKISLKEICDDLNIGSIWPLMNSMRNHVKSYGGGYFYSFRKNVSNEEMVLYFKAVYLEFKKIFKGFKPDIILAVNFVEVPHIICSILADKYGAKMIVPTDSKIQGIKIFTTEYTESQGSFYDHFDSLVKGEIISKNIDRAKEYIEEFRQKFKEPDYMAKYRKSESLVKKIRRELSPYREIIRWFSLKKVNHLPNLGFTVDYRPPRIILRDFYFHKKYKKFIDNYHYDSILDDGKYVYFPLQFQPEATIDVTAPFFSNQIEVARLIAMALPDDYILVVKDHPAMAGYRKPSYLEKIASIPNVKLIDYRLRSDDVLKKVDLVISPNSTTVAEAAFYQVPAIQFGDLGKTLLLPNVFKHSDFTTLSVKIKEVLKIDLKSDEYEKRLESYVAAAFDKGFDLDYWGLWELGNDVDMEKLWNIYLSEIIYFLENGSIA